jgi:predicted RNase H-like HicB family nuclease
MPRPQRYEVAVYSATVRRDGLWWFVYVPELDIAGQARTLSEVEDVAREAIGLALDIDPDPLAVSVTVETPEDVRELWEDAAYGDAQARNGSARPPSATARLSGA